MPFFSLGKFLNIYSNMNWAGRCHSSAPFFVTRAPMMSFQCLTLGWLCCIATYERLTIVRIISNLLKILFFCNQSDQI
ncbi:hypothetical protein [Wolbachia endosymbiont (group A) of Philonthus cognatus]|uniref:hypothetical protein n=1 Tax=Wolbachia endosymbiont (group A) of Philonthus cognatus TaxID=2954046 RepID=UPI00222F96E8|nr:hypothetical protein [Wolbachia endosymbiont (group A) of Philonthus cognatus]